MRGTDFGRLYLVVFRSLRREEADLDLRRERARQAHREAIGMGGLLRYFKGEANERRECLSFCQWETRGQAKRAVGGASHSGAASIAAQTYERYDLERYHLTKDEDAEGASRSRDSRGSSPTGDRRPRGHGFDSLSPALGGRGRPEMGCNMAARRETTATRRSLCSSP